MTASTISGAIAITLVLAVASFAFGQEITVMMVLSVVLGVMVGSSHG
jgi:hypothetical protein